MPRRCSCFGCKGNYDGTPYVKVISFPKDPEEREKWILAMPNEKESLRHLKEIYICDIHFNCEWVSVKGGKRPKEPPSIFPGIQKSALKQVTSAPRPTSSSTSEPRAKKTLIKEEVLEDAIVKEGMSEADYQISSMQDHEPMVLIKEETFEFEQVDSESRLIKDEPMDIVKEETLEFEQLDSEIGESSAIKKERKNPKRGCSPDTAPWVGGHLDQDDDGELEPHCVDMNESDIDIVDTETESATGPQLSLNEAQNPWPHLDDYFMLTSREADKLLFSCKLCLPKTVLIKGHKTSLNNLKQHIKRTHPAKFMRFEEVVKAGSSRGKAAKKKQIFSSDSSNCSLFSPPDAKKSRQPTIGQSFGIDAAERNVPQDAVDQRIVDLFIANILPLSVVESDTFEKLIKTLNPSKNSISRRTLGRRIVKSHTDLKQYLIRVLDDVPWVATTADCWSAHRKAYLGMTAHWLDPITRQRLHGVLACISLVGRPTYDVLAQAIVNVHYEFHIQNKVTRTTTDNGSNFVKAFVQFGSDADTLPDLQVAGDVDEDDHPDSDDAAVAALLAESVDEQEFEYVSLTDCLAVPVADSDDVDTIVDNSMNLPVHMRCAAHTFNLVASKDADAALKSAVFKVPYKAAMAKARALWNLQDRSTVAADSIYLEVGRRMVVPNTTSWNSIYDNVVFLNTILENKRPALHRVMTQLKINSFNNQDVGLLKEYAKVMSPVAQALEKIQGEEQAYFGTLLPTVAATILRLKDLKSKNIAYCSPLIDALLAGIDKRFRHLLEDDGCQLAAAFHPKFRLIWLEKYDQTKVAKVRKSMESKVEEVLSQHSGEMTSNSGSSNNDDDEEEDFFTFITQQQKSSRSHWSIKAKSQSLVKTWLETNSKDILTDAAFLGEQVLVDLFIRLNTSIPSSAAVGRLFSFGKDILRAKRPSLSDDNFQMLLFMKGNMHLLDKIEKYSMKTKT